MKQFTGITFLISLSIISGAVIKPLLRIESNDNNATDANQSFAWEKSRKYEGDIILTPAQKNGFLNTKYRWPKNTLVYIYDSSVTSSNRLSIDNALKWFTQNTCIKLKKRTMEKDYIQVSAANSGCWSYIGKQGGRQFLNLASPGCMSKATILHEFIHALGFFHMQSATNRDKYVRVYLENVSNGQAHNFDKYSAAVIGNFGEIYDLKSIMHYSEYAFSKNGKVTIKALNGVSPLGNRNGPTASDRRRIMKMYKC